MKIAGNKRLLPKIDGPAGLRDHGAAARADAQAAREELPVSAGTETVRAGILVTGTEVITARITDRNGPWVSERLAELGVEVAHILIVRRPAARTSRRRCASWPTRAAT